MLEKVKTVRTGIVLTGPTASGKSLAAIRLADHLHARGCRAEIVSADALCIYKELSIGTAKPSAEDRRRIRHHAIDVRSVKAARGKRPDYSAGEFAKDFFSILPRLPDPVILAGGTAFYIDAVIRGLAENPPADEELRERMEADEAESPGSAFERLRRIDPEAAKKIGPANLQRLIRAVEVCEMIGGKFSGRARKPPPFKPVVFVLEKPRAELYRSIDERARRMFSDGLIEEVEQVLARYGPDLPALGSIGYAEAVQVIRGTLSIEQAIARTAQRSRHLAKRQLTWWRHFRYEDVRFVSADVLPCDILAQMKPTLNLDAKASR